MEANHERESGIARFSPVFSNLQDNKKGIGPGRANLLICKISQKKYLQFMQLCFILISAVT
ncbi:hypothetical protein D3Z36_04835 [Lachnospiraceae bacterium]|nr:hypothetical protein [Lachnospiraceae bacterium]